MKNDERQYNLDLLKALAIVCMIMCHAVFRLAMYRPGYENEFLYFFADAILGGYVVVAHGFMFAMGVGIIYSRRNSPGQLVHRGVNILLIAYVLNFFRSGMYYLAEGLITGNMQKTVLQALFGSDILQFAGLALIATGILRKLKLKETEMLFIALILSMIGAVAAGVDVGKDVPNLLIGLFVYTTHNTSTFAFCSWYLFVAVGLVFGKILQNTQNKDALYKGLLVVSGIIAAIYSVASYAFGAWFLSVDKAYYDASPLEAIGLLAIDFFILSVFYFLLKRVDASKFKRSIEMSKNINTIYCIHWCIIGAVDFFFCHLLQLEFLKNYAVLYIFGVIVLVVSFLLARYYQSFKKRHMNLLE